MQGRNKQKVNGLNNDLPPLPPKRYFTIGEASQLCNVKPHVLRYWEQEFTQLKPNKRRGNRRYYQHKDVYLIRQIRHLLYDQGYTIIGARNFLSSHRGKSDEVGSTHQENQGTVTEQAAKSDENQDRTFFIEETIAELESIIEDLENKS